MVRINLEVIMHKLEVDPNYFLTRQKRRKFAYKCNKIISKEVKKLKWNGFIEEAYYQAGLPIWWLYKRRTENDGFISISLI